MSRSKPHAIDDILSKHNDDETAHYDLPDNRKQAAKVASKPGQRNAQAWRTIEDLKANRYLDRELKEVYEEE